VNTIWTTRHPAADWGPKESESYLRPKRRGIPGIFLPMKARVFISVALAALLFPSPRLAAQTLPVSVSSVESTIESAISTSGSFSIVPVDTWGSGDFDALSDTWFGYTTPRTNQMNISMDQTATTTYEGDLFLRKLKLKIGLNVDVDNNFIGKLSRFMGYINYSGLALRVQTSELSGTATWDGATVADMPAQCSFDNRFISVDLLYYRKNDSSMYYGIGYTSYQLPVQLDCLTYDDSRQEVWWANGSVYQPDMAFHIYSALLGFDTLHGAFEKSGMYGSMQGFSFWASTQDRAGVGLSYISDQAKRWVEAENGKPLWSAEQIAMLVDYYLTLGLQWVGDVGPARLGIGLGFNLGGQTLTCVTPKGPVDSSHVDASPSVYLFHYGPILSGIVSW
jgi:hypothetical protein